MTTPDDLYSVLGVPSTSSQAQIKRAYKAQIAKHHPDKPGGDAAAFARLHAAYEVLSDAGRRAGYDATGHVARSAEDEFADSFAGGSFGRGGAPQRRDEQLGEENMAENLVAQITQRRDEASHSAGFDAWMRGRGGVKTYTAQDVIADFGVVKGSYDTVPLPRIKAHTVLCKPGGETPALSAELVALGEELEWGQVLCSMRAAPIDPDDIRAVDEAWGTTTPAHVPGHDGVGVVMKVGPGVSQLSPGDVVVPLRGGADFGGTWRTLAVVREDAVLRLPEGLGFPLEQAAWLRHYITAFRLLEGADLKPGDAVALNAADSAVGQLVVQLAASLRLRTVAVVAAGGAARERAAAALRSLGASVVLADRGSLKHELDKLRFFAKPKLALDAVGGASTARLSELLADNGTLVVHHSLPSRAPVLNWQRVLRGGLRVQGFDARQWMADQRARLLPVLESLAKLVAAGKLSVECREYELASELGDALAHARENPGGAQALLRMTDVGEKF